MKTVLSIHAINAIAKQHGVDPSSEKAIQQANKVLQLHAKSIKAARKCSDEEALELAIKATSAQYEVAVKEGKSFFPPRETKRWNTTAACLAWMLVNRHRGDFSVKELANFLFSAGLLSTLSGKAEARGVGDALGGHGLRIKKHQGGVYPIPTNASDFTDPRVLEEIGFKDGENALETLCRYFEVPTGQDEVIGEVNA